MRRVYIAAAALLLFGCGGDTAGPTEEIPPALVGRWAAEPACSPGCRFTLTWTENPQAFIDFVALGISVEVEVTKAGRFTLDFSGGEPPAPGTVEVVGSTMYVTDTRGLVDTIDYRIDGATLHLDLRRLYLTHDFNGDGVKDPSRASGDLKKRP